MPFGCSPSLERQADIADAAADASDALAKANRARLKVENIELDRADIAQRWSAVCNGRAEVSRETGTLLLKLARLRELEEALAPALRVNGCPAIPAYMIPTVEGFTASDLLEELVKFARQTDGTAGADKSRVNRDVALDLYTRAGVDVENPDMSGHEQHKQAP